MASRLASSSICLTSMALASAAVMAATCSAAACPRPASRRSARAASSASSRSCRVTRAGRAGSPWRRALLAAGQPLLALLDLDQAGAGLDLDLSSKLGRLGLDALAEPQGLVAGFQGGLAAGRLGLAAGVLEHRLGLLLAEPSTVADCLRG